MMKEFRFEPSSQMIEVQEGQNLKIRITGYRTAYRSVELKICAKCCMLCKDALRKIFFLPINLCFEGLEGTSAGTI